MNIDEMILRLRLIESQTPIYLRARGHIHSVSGKVVPADYERDAHWDGEEEQEPEDD
jgi:hypothetical protein